MDKVTVDQNIGQWLNDRYKDPSSMKAVINRVIYRGSVPPGLVSMAPNKTENDLMIGLDQLCYGPNAKFGCFLSHH